MIKKLLLQFVLYGGAKRYYADLNKAKYFVEKQIPYEKYTVEYNLNKRNWELGNEKKKFLDVSVQKRKE